MDLRDFRLCERPSAPMGRVARLAINSADHERNPPELGLLEREIKRVKYGRVLPIQASAETVGHDRTGQARFRSRELAKLLAAAPNRGM
jgi:homoserine O-acetyltransferase/O-succinyltransferase